MNKWSQIKNKKAASDSAKGKIFTQMSRLITSAVKEAGGNVDAPGVLAVVERAKRADVTRDVIDRALKKGADKNEAALEPVIYEGYGPAGVAFIITALTDNRNRTAQEIKHLFSKQGFSMGTPGSVMWGFTKTPDGEYLANPGTEVAITEPHLQLFQDMTEAFENHDDVTGVFSNEDVVAS